VSLAERRAAAARFFTMPENGRFTRTYVNRIWAQLMGKGIAANVDDMAARPSNPDLLDWLASDFVEHGYDARHLLRRILTSGAYQARDAGLRRMSAEQFLDSIAEITGEWRVLEDRSTKSGGYAREWRFKSSMLSRALGRPIRDQVTTTRLTQPTTLQALELSNGSTLATLLSRGAKRMLGQLPEAPRSLFDSGVLRGTKNPPVIDLDVTGRDELWLLMADVDSYDPSRVRGGFLDAELVGTDGASVKVGEVAELKLPAEVRLDLRGKGYTRFRATAALEAASTTSDVNGTVRFFVFGEKPDTTRLLPAEGARPVEPSPVAGMTQPRLIEHIYRFAFSRAPGVAEMAAARAMLGGKTTPESLEDLLWAVVMSPEFQYIR
jgi:hypothetical protein